MPRIKDLVGSPFKDYVAPLPSVDGNHAESRGGVSIPDGQKETPGIMGTQPTFMDVQGAPAPGSSLIDRANVIATSPKKDLTTK